MAIVLLDTISPMWTKYGDPIQLLSGRLSSKQRVCLSAYSIKQLRLALWPLLSFLEFYDKHNLEIKSHGLYVSDSGDLDDPIGFS